MKKEQVAGPYTWTDALIDELERCLDKMRMYKVTLGSTGQFGASKAHAAAWRASLDLTSLLAQWRQTGANLR